MTSHLNIQTEKKNKELTSEHISVQSITKKIGSTTYSINIYCNDGKKETFEDKVKRLLMKIIDVSKMND